MTKTLKLLIATSIVALAPTMAHAQLLDGWTGSAGVSGSTTSGNTDTTDVGVSLDLTKTADVWRHKFDATYDLGSADGEDTKNRLYLGYQIDRDITERLYAYGNANYFRDDFGAYETGYFVGAGLGYQVIKADPTFWRLEGGLGFRSQETRATGTVGTVGFVDSVSDEELALRLGSEFKYALNDSVSFYNNSEVISSSSDTYLWNDAGIEAQLAGNFSARFGIRVDHHTDVPVGTEQTDTITRGALVYTIQ